MQPSGFMGAQYNAGDASFSNVPEFRRSGRHEDVESLLGRASLRLSTSMALDGGRIVATPCVTASVFHEFARRCEGLRFGDGRRLRSDDELFLDRQRHAHGQAASAPYDRYGARQIHSSSPIVAGLVSPAWTTVTGDNIESLSGTAGMRYQLNSDLGGLKEGGLKDAPAAGHWWNGPYVGVFRAATGGNTLDFQRGLDERQRLSQS